MTISEAQSKLPTGFTLRPDPNTRRTHALIAVKDGVPFGTVPSESYIIQEAAGKVGFIHREILLAQGQEVDYETYRNQIISKYGPESKNPAKVRLVGSGTTIHPDMQWQWDASHNLLDVTACAATSMPGGLVEDGSGWMTIRFLNPALRSAPGCYLSLVVSLWRYPGTRVIVPQTAVNRIIFRLFDEQPFLDDSVKALALQNAQEQQRRNAAQQRPGPPM